MKKWRKEKYERKKIKGVQLNEIFPLYNLWSYTRVRVPFASKSCSAVTMKQHSCEDEGKDAGVSHTLHLLQFESYMKVGALPYYRV